MRLLVLLLSLSCVLTTSTVYAKIYTWTDDSGTTIYGDTPPEYKKAEEVVTRELTVVQGYKDPSLNSVSSSPAEQSSEETEELAYESFIVSYPKNDEAIRANTGNITVSFQLSPGLKKTDSVFVYLDGKKVVEDSKSLSASLANLDRGSHSLFAVVRNDNGDVLVNSNTVSFHVLRHSIIPGSPPFR